MGKKATFIINWNYIATVLGVITIVFGFWVANNQNVSEELQARIDLLKEENNKMASELDPEWHTRMNDQTEYYESVLRRQKALETQKLDSINQEIVRRFETEGMVITSEEAKTIRKIAAENDYLKAVTENDSALIAALENIISAQEMALDASDKIEAYSDSIQLNNERIIDLLEEETGITIFGVDRRIYLLLLITINFIVLVLFAWITFNKGTSG